MYHQHKCQMYEWLPFNRGELDKVPQLTLREGHGSARAGKAGQMLNPSGKSLSKPMDMRQDRKSNIVRHSRILATEHDLPAKISNVSFRSLVNKILAVLI